jgi:hypothetical protein
LKKKDNTSNETEEVKEERYSTSHVKKTGLRAIITNNEEVIVKIERKAKELTRDSIRISHFLNLFVLRCLENNEYIPKLNNSFIQ